MPHIVLWVLLPYSGYFVSFVCFLAEASAERSTGMKPRAEIKPKRSKIEDNMYAVRERERYIYIYTYQISYIYIYIGLKYSNVYIYMCMYRCRDFLQGPVVPAPKKVCGKMAFWLLFRGSGPLFYIFLGSR